MHLHTQNCQSVKKCTVNKGSEFMSGEGGGIFFLLYKGGGGHFSNFYLSKGGDFFLLLNENTPWNKNGPVPKQCSIMNVVSYSSTDRYDWH